METINILPESSEKTDIVLAQLMKAKAEMGSAVKKDATNPFHKNKYATLGAHLEVSEGVLFKHGLLMLHTPNLINNQHFLVASLHHPESGQWIKSYLPLPNQKGDSQGIGASITYMRRYSINSMLGLNAEDDDGETASGRGKNQDKGNGNSVAQAQPKEQATHEKIGKSEVIALTTLVNALDKESEKGFLEWIKKDFNSPSINDLPKDGYEKCISKLNAKIKYLKDQEKLVAIA